MAVLKLQHIFENLDNVVMMLGRFVKVCTVT
jgi:hypothetical protein